ncbi:TIGR00266 family protein [Pseudomonas cichorii]|nr:TIGR00266 family protein [Pseudomonas cichorii]MBX8489523.1 TIGR00266 family protein [Pseudomonas cichorii]MBX8509288.1 TIGR00266 family protein [Pseudomonas cichorii]MBX8521625.1 TIGR00266 family protein [Pseudomonas cichorii]MBX8524147.1 TIGR00266 family protein [Pseudomonas cichorii]MBX8541513.1 TIGR00266 family protein [Pseudomonas cichorii]
MEQWFVVNAGKQLGPMDAAAARLIAREAPGAWCWKQGMPDWQPIYQVQEVRAMKKDGVTPFPDPSPDMIQPRPSALPAHTAPAPAPTPAPVPATVPASRRPSFTPDPNTSSGFGSGQATDGVDFKLYGTETQFVELELDRGESAVAEAGSMMYKTCDVQMETIFGDGSSQSSGLLGSLLGAGKRMLTGESLFTTVFSQQGSGKGRVAFAAPYPGTILPLHLRDFSGKLICQKDSFLAGAKGVSIGIQFQKKILTGLFGGEGFVLQKLEGDGWVFIHMGGTVRRIELSAGESLDVDTGCLAAMTQSVDYDIRMVGGIKSMLFGGEGVFFARLTGPGTVWLQSLPFSRLAGRMLAASPAGVARSER